MKKIKAYIKKLLMQATDLDYFNEHLRVYVILHLTLCVVLIFLFSVFHNGSVDSLLAKNVLWEDGLLMMVAALIEKFINIYICVKLFFHDISKDKYSNFKMVINNFVYIFFIKIIFAVILISINNLFTGNIQNMMAALGEYIVMPLITTSSFLLILITNAGKGVKKALVIPSCLIFLIFFIFGLYFFEISHIELIPILLIILDVLLFNKEECLEKYSNWM